ncbi:cathelicidin antimicrobial peptide-like isoform X2 [Marmota flaviventris]|uniref:cathelicidin antimicrobial peptide-like isoform X2 n=1 Tax=Marmota flaviventris TaxID=93162 RepID=UPI000FFFA7C7|nr:cathelicidin antimicrobial peptide-like isoform X2 [Marmota flaviventris]
MSSPSVMFFNLSILLWQMYSIPTPHRLQGLLGPPGTRDEDPDTPKPVSFTVKETVCPKTTQQTLEQCDFKEDGLVKRCVGTVTLDPARDSFDINCDGPQHFKKTARLGGLLQKGGEKIGEKLENIGRKIKDFFQSLVPRSRS